MYYNAVHVLKYKLKDDMEVDCKTARKCDHQRSGAGSQPLEKCQLADKHQPTDEHACTESRIKLREERKNEK